MVELYIDNTLKKIAISPYSIVICIAVIAVSIALAYFLYHVSYDGLWFSRADERFIRNICYLLFISALTLVLFATSFPFVISEAKNEIKIEKQWEEALELTNNRQWTTYLDGQKEQLNLDGMNHNNYTIAIDEKSSSVYIISK